MKELSLSIGAGGGARAVVDILRHLLPHAPCRRDLHHLPRVLCRDPRVRHGRVVQGSNPEPRTPEAESQDPEYHMKTLVMYELDFDQNYDTFNEYGYVW